MKAEQFIKEYTMGCSNIEYTQGVYAPSYHPWLTPEQALRAVEITREELIEWLEENIDKYLYITGEFASRKMFEDLKKAMEE